MWISPFGPAVHHLVKFHPLHHHVGLVIKDVDSVMSGTQNGIQVTPLQIAVSTLSHQGKTRTCQIGPSRQLLVIIVEKMDI